MQRSFTQMLRDESPSEYFDRQMKKELGKEGRLREIKKQNYKDQLLSLNETELEIFMEALDEVHKEQRS